MATRVFGPFLQPDLLTARWDSGIREEVLLVLIPVVVHVLDIVVVLHEFNHFFTINIDTFQKITTFQELLSKLLRLTILPVYHS